MGGVAAGVLVTLTVTGCGSASTDSLTDPPAATSSAVPAIAATHPVSSSPRPTAVPDRRTPLQRAEDTFSTITAAHLCAVQSTVYANLKAMAAAYAEVPPYPGLTTGQVAGFRARMAQDKAFAGRVYTQLQASCKPGTS